MTTVNLCKTRRNINIVLNSKPVRKRPVPLVVIGLGSAGTRIVSRVKEAFAEHFELPVDGEGKTIPVPAHTAYLAFDNESCPANLSPDDEFSPVYPVLVPGEYQSQPGDYLCDFLGKQTGDESTWACEPTYVIGTDWIRTRQTSRITFNRRFDEARENLRRALLRAVQGAEEEAPCQEPVEIVICTSICGSVGSGLFLDVPQVIRHLMETEPALCGRSCRITGYIIMPDVILQVLSDSNPIAEYLLATGYAALKELDFWMNVDQHHTPYTMNYGGHTPIAWSRKPYDQCILMSSRTTDGAVIPNAGEAIRNTIADHLLFSLADEQPADGDAASSLRCFEDNLRANAAMLPPPRPFGYSYRALNVFSLRFPRKKLLRFEGACFLEAYLHLKDENGHPAAGDALLNTVQPLQRAQGIIGNVRDLHANFARECSLPNWGAGAAPGGVIPVLQQMQPRPHDRENTKPNPWVDSIARPAAAQSAEHYLTGAWKRFEDFCAPVLGNPELGPFALRDYLDHPDKGLIKEMENQVAVWMNMGRKFKMDLSALKQACTASWPDFEHPPLLGRTRALETYLQNLNNYYSGLRKAVFMECYSRAAQKLLLRMREYLANGLKPMCADVERLYTVFKEIPDDDATLGSDVLDIEILKPRIVQQFTSSNENKRITLSFLKSLCLESLKTVSNRDTDTSGVTFVYRKEGREAVLTVMKETLNECFDGINNQSLDALMIQAVGEDVGQQQKFMEDIANSVMASAHPLFAQDSATAGEVRADYSYLSVPDNAPEHIAHFNNILATEHVQAKGSSLRDHINCLMAWDGLPMYRYSMMQELRQAYAQGLQDPKVSMGVHLVWNGNGESDYTNNWCRLPEPRPFYFFSAHGDATEEKAWNEARSLTERAIKCGMMKVDISDVAPIFNLHVFWTDAHRNTPVPASVLAERVNSILNQKMDPATGATLTPEQKLAMIKAYEGQAAVTALEPGKSSECMAPYLGLVGQDINPWDTNIAIDPTRKVVAEKNHKTLSELMAAAILSANPRLLLVVKNQIEGFEAIDKAKGQIEGMAKIWAPRIAYAETYAKMMCHNLLKFSPVGAIFTDEMGTPTPVVQEVLMKDDLKNQPVFTKVCGYLADLPETNQIRMLLDHQTKIKEDEYNQKALNGLLTMEDCVNGMAICDRMKGLVDNELRQKKAGLTQLGADVATLNKCIAMLTAVTSFLETRKGQLDWAKQMLG